MRVFFLTMFFYLFLFFPVALFSQKSKAGENIDIFYGRFYFEPSLTSYYLNGAVTYYFEVKFESDTISFDFNNNLQVDSVYVNGISDTLYFFDDGLLRIVNQGMTAGEIDSVSIFYHGDAVPSEGEYPSYFFSMQHTNDTIPVMWTLSEPYGAKLWFPCKQHLSDKIDSIDVFIKHDSGFLGVSNGMYVGQYNDGNKIVTHWKHTYSIETYLIAIAVSKYYVYEITYNDTIYGYSFPIKNYIYLEMIEDTANINFVTDIMAFYVSKFGEYPFKNEKYAQLICEMNGGMEHQTVSFLEDFGYELVAHELAHMWFGDYITCKSWHDIWLNEGFATYLTGLCYEKFYPDQYWYPWKSITLETILSLPDGSVYCDDTTDVFRIFDSRLSYRKGAYLLHMLRWELGDSAFFTGLRNYLNDPDLAYSYATVNDLKQHLEIAGDTVLDEFFSDWYYSEGFPIFNIGYVQNENNLLYLEISQTPSFGNVIFDVTLPIVVYYDGGDSLLRVPVHNSLEIKEISLPFIVDSIVFDPDLWIITPHDNVIHILLSDEKNKTDINIYPNPVSKKLYVDAKGEKFSVKIINEKGLTVFEKKNIIDNTVLNLKELSEGFYFILVSASSGKKYLKKIVKN